MVNGSLTKKQRQNNIFKRQSFQKIVLEQQYCHMQNIKIKKNLDTDFKSLTKINSKWTTRLNVKCKNCKTTGTVH